MSRGIGWDTLHTACVAQVKAILEGYKVECVHFVDVMKPNRIRPNEHCNSRTSTSCIENYWGSFRRTFIFIEA